MPKNLTQLSSRELLSHAKTLAADERRATLALIESLAEIDRRQLYSELGYASLWELATHELGLSESAAYRRIQAARLLRDVPEAKASLESGTLSLSNAAKMQSFRKAEKKRGRRPDAVQLVKEVESLSQRQCEAKLFEISPEALPRERERIVSAEAERELKIVVSAELYDKLQRIKGLIAHARPDASYAELFQYLADAQLARLEKQKGISEDAESIRTSAAKGTAQQPLPAGRRVYLPVSLRKAVWSRSGGRCEFVHEGRRCTSRHFLQIDHRRPLALGGANDLANLRNLCQGHNLQQARERLG